MDEIGEEHEGEEMHCPRCGEHVDACGCTFEEVMAFVAAVLRGEIDATQD